jgi:phosphatidylserine decarboxylase
MRLPVTKFGWPQVVIFPAILLGAMIIAFVAWPERLSVSGIIVVEVVLGLVLGLTLSFFRDPARMVPADQTVMLAPADGRITDIELVEEDDFIGATALRIGIFLSILDVHINRAPCNVRVEKVTYRPGKYVNAASPLAGRVNESNDLALVQTDSPGEKLLVRQISGAIARRIVCAASQGQQLASGQKFGMIKFGSRTELYVPVRRTSGSGEWSLPNGAKAECLVQVGDRVKAGVSAVVRYELCPE